MFNMLIRFTRYIIHILHRYMLFFLCVALFVWLGWLVGLVCLFLCFFVSEFLCFFVSLFVLRVSIML